MYRTIPFFSPFAAGLHVYAQLAFLLSLGALGSWVREHWLPATRWFWSSLFDVAFAFHINVSDQEKDSLTAVAFFAPLAITTLVVRLRERFSRDEEEKEKLSTPAILRFVGFFVAIFILILVSRQITADALEIIGRTTEGSKSVRIFSVYSLLILSVFTLVLVIVYRLDIGIRRYLLVFGASAAGILEILIVGAPMIIGAYIAATELGPIRSISILLVALSISFTVFARPLRILQIAAFVGVLIVAGEVWDRFQEVKT